MAVVKSFFKNLQIDKEIFKKSQCILTISVGQKYHEEDRLAAAIELVNNSFAACVLLIGDSLQRYTMALNSVNSPDSFYLEAQRQGDLWLERNEKYYKTLNNLIGISRWDTWLNHINYAAKRNQILSLLHEDPSYKAIFDSTIDTYLNKYCNRLHDSLKFDRERANNLCFDYIVEECTILCLLTELDCQFEIYPNRHNEAMKETCARFITPEYPYLLNALTLGFRNAGLLMPQTFVLTGDKD